MSEQKNKRQGGIQVNAIIALIVGLCPKSIESIVMQAQDLFPQAFS